MLLCCLCPFATYPLEGSYQNTGVGMIHSLLTACHNYWVSACQAKWKWQNKRKGLSQSMQMK